MLAGRGACPTRAAEQLRAVPAAHRSVENVRDTAGAGDLTQKVNRSEPCITRGVRVETTSPKSAFTCCPFGWKRAAVLRLAY